MAMHTCAECGLAHDSGTPAEIPESDAVRIARIEADRDVKVAQLQARQEHDWNETRIEEAKIEARADVEVAQSEAEIIGDAIEAASTPEEAAEVILPDPDPEPVPDMEPDPTDIPLADHSDSPAAPKRKGLGLGMW